MVFLRYLILFAIAAAGIGLISGSFAGVRIEHQGWSGLAVGALALVVAALVFRAIRSGRLPLRTWYVLPLALGIATGAPVYEITFDSFINFAPFMVGLGTVLVSFSVLQLWADRRGGRDWTGIVILLVILVGGSLPGQIAWLSQ